MIDNIMLDCEAIVNFPQVETSEKGDRLTGHLFFSKDTSVLVKDALKKLKVEYKNHTINLRSVGDKIDALQKRLELEPHKQHEIDTLKSIAQEYPHSHGFSGRLEFLKCIDMYQKDLPPTSLRSGDRIFVRLTLKPTKFTEKTGKGATSYQIQIFANIITLLEKGAFDLSAARGDDTDYFEALTFYKEKHLTPGFIGLEDDLPL